MFFKSTLPSQMPAGIPKAVSVALDEYRDAVALHDRASNAEGIGDADLAQAREADHALMLDALRSGDDIEKVGKPHEAAMLNRREAYRKAEQLANTEAAEIAFRTAAVLADHKEEVIEAFAGVTDRAAVKYREAITALGAARHELEVAANRLQWATAIKPGVVPGIAEEHGRQVLIRTATYGTRELEILLENDAAMADSMLQAERRAKAAREVEEAAIARQEERSRAVTAESLRVREARLARRAAALA